MFTLFGALAAAAVNSPSSIHKVLVRSPLCEAASQTLNRITYGIAAGRYAFVCARVLWTRACTRAKH